jgi:hypothetical protein
MLVFTHFDNKLSQYALEIDTEQYEALNLENETF